MVPNKYKYPKFISPRNDNNKKLGFFTKDETKKEIKKIESYRKKQVSIHKTEEFQKDISEFYRAKISAQQALKQWAIQIIKKAIKIVPKSVDEKF